MIRPFKSIQYYKRTYLIMDEYFNQLSKIKKDSTNKEF